MDNPKQLRKKIKIHYDEQFRLIEKNIESEELKMYHKQRAHRYMANEMQTTYNFEQLCKLYE